MRDPLGIPDCELIDSQLCDATPVGRVNTPPGVARWMARCALSAISGRQSKGLTILEPAAGSGVLIAALVEALAASRTVPASGARKKKISGAVRPTAVTGRRVAAALNCIWAIDSDGDIRQAAVRRLGRMCGATREWARRQYRVGDALLDEKLLPDCPIDLIVGNPPYLGQRHASRLAGYARLADRFGVREDLYSHFIRWALETVRPGGVVTMLVPDGWMTLAGYEGLRRLMLSGRFHTIVRVPNRTFDRQVSPCFIVWQRTRPSGRLTLIDARTGEKEAQRYRVEQDIFLAAPRTVFFVPSVDAMQRCRLWQDLQRRMAPRLNPERPVRAGDVVRMNRVARIIDAGIHSRNCRHRLFYREPAVDGLHRLLQGRQVGSFAVRWDSAEAQYRWVDIHYVPKPGTLGRRGNGQPSVREEYWDWQGDPAIHRLPERILIRQTGDRIVAARCIQNGVVHYTDNTLFTAVLTAQGRHGGLSHAFLTGYLNSEPVTRLYRFLSGEQGRRQAQVKVRLLRELPFVWPTALHARQVESLVFRMERLVARNKDGSQAQSAIDSIFESMIASATRKRGRLDRESRRPARLALA